MVGWLGGSLENWRVILISAFNYVIVEVVAEIGKMQMTKKILIVYIWNLFFIQGALFLSFISPII